MFGNIILRALNRIAVAIENQNNRLDLLIGMQTANYTKAIKQQPATPRDKQPNKPKFVYKAVDVETGETIKAFRQIDIMVRFGATQGGHVSRKFNGEDGGLYKASNGKTYRLSKEQYVEQ